MVAGDAHRSSGTRQRLTRVYSGAIARLGDRLAGLPGCRDPGVLGALDLGQSLLGAGAKRRARLQVRDVGDIAGVLIAVKDVDLVVAHGRFQPQIVALDQPHGTDL